MKEKLRIGVVSCAEMAQRHMSAVEHNANCELYMICDLDEKKIREAANRFNVEKTTTDYREIISDPDVDAIIIVSPDQTHREITVEALKAGKHVLCEKPMALTIEDCKAMVQASRETDKKLMVGQICRFAPGFKEAKKLIDRGDIGELFYVETEYAHDYSKIGEPWRLDPLRHGFLGGGCHAVDLARWIAGDPIEITAYSNHKMLPQYPTDDCTIAILKYPNDVIGKIFVSTGCKRDYTMRSVFYGSKGTIITDNTSPYMTVFQDGLSDGKSMLADLPQSHAIPVQYHLDISSHNTIGELEEFVDCIVNDKPVAMSALEGAKTVITALAAVESTKTGKAVHPDYNI